MNTEYILEQIIEECKGLPMDEALRVMDNRLKEVDNAIGQIKQQKGFIRKLATSIVKWASGQYKTRYRTVLFISNEVNEMYEKINYLLGNDTDARKAHSGDIIKITSKGINVRHKKKNTTYQFTYGKVFVPFDQIQDMIYRGIRNADNEKDIENNMKYVYDQVKQFIENNYWYINDTEVVLSGEIAIKIRVEDAIMEIKSALDNLYAIIGTETNVMSYCSQYELLINKSYGEMERLFGDSPTAMKYINTIYKDCIEITQKAIAWNSKGSDEAVNLMKYYLDQLEDIYENIRK